MNLAVLILTLTTLAFTKGYANLGPSPDGKFTLGAEWLNWKAQLDNMSLARTEMGNLNPQSPDFFVNESHLIEANFKYTNGFRLTMGYQLPCESWEGNFIYTYLPTSAKSKPITAVNPTQSDIGPFLIIAPYGAALALEQLKGQLKEVLPFNTDYQTFEQHWNLTINQVDLDIARPIFINDSISLRPHVGFRWLWFTDKQKGTFTGTSTPPPLLAQEEHATFKSDALFRSKFTGYGVESGVFATWFIYEGLSFLGHFGGAILYSKFSVNEVVDTTVVTYQPAGPTLINPFTTSIFDTIHTATPMIDYFIGIEYADEMCDIKFALFIGWEQHMYFKTNKISIFNGNLSTQGLTLGFEAGF